MKLNPQRITLVAFLIPVCSLILEFLAFPEELPAFVAEQWGWLAFLGKFVYLDFFHARFLEYHNFDTGLETRYLDLIFYGVMLVGAVAYKVSQQRETRLLRFSFAVIGFAGVLFVLERFASVGMYWHEHVYQMKVVNWIQYVLFIAKSAFFSYFSYEALTYLKAGKTMHTIPNAEGQEEFVLTPKVQRFFHLIVDLFLCMFMLSGFAQLYMGGFIESVEDKFGERTALFLLMLIFRLIYYPFFETVLGATPAKLLTGSRALVKTGAPVNLSRALERTVCRFVPFEPFSFFGDEGWHDKWTGSMVVKEVNPGVSGSRYAWMLPGVIVLGLLGYWGFQSYEDYTSYVYARNEHEKKFETLSYEINNLSPDHYLRLVDEQDEYATNKIFLKIEKVNGDLVEASMFLIGDYNEDPGHVAAQYHRYPEYRSEEKIKRSNLLKALTPDYDAYDEGKRNTAQVLSDGKRYYVQEIFVEGAPKIEDGSSSSINGDYISLGIKNCGWPATITSIKNLEGDIQWANTAPYLIEGITADASGCPSFSMDGSGYDRRTHYKFEITVEDLQKRVTRYEIEGTDLNRTLRRKFEP